MNEGGSLLPENQWVQVCLDVHRNSHVGNATSVSLYHYLYHPTAFLVPGMIPGMILGSEEAEPHLSYFNENSCYRTFKNTRNAPLPVL